MQETISIEYITPEIASEYLKLNTRNRNISRNVIRIYIAAMKSGEWVFNGDTIVFDEDGLLVDGQHRLTACIYAKYTLKSIVVRNASKSAFKTKDVGKKRTASDILDIEGYKNYVALSAVAGMVYIWQSTGTITIPCPERRPSTSDISELCKNTPELIESVNFTTAHTIIKKIVSPSIAGFCHYVFKNKNSEMCDEFFKCFINGDKGYEGSPIILLRDALAFDLAATRKMSKIHKTALIFKAFKQFSKKQQVKTLRIRMEGDMPEKDLFLI